MAADTADDDDEHDDNSDYWVLRRAAFNSINNLKKV